MSMTTKRDELASALFAVRVGVGDHMVQECWTSDEWIYEREKCYFAADLILALVAPKWEEASEGAEFTKISKAYLETLLKAEAERDEWKAKCFNLENVTRHADNMQAEAWLAVHKACVEMGMECGDDETALEAVIRFIREAERRGFERGLSAARAGIEKKVKLWQQETKYSGFSPHYRAKRGQHAYAGGICVAVIDNLTLEAHDDEY